MNLILHQLSDRTVAETTGNALILRSEADVIPLLEELFGSGAQALILHQAHLAPAFFDLRSGLAGAILQKFVNYHIRVAIVGDFANVPSQSLRAFIYESNQGQQIYFVEDAAAAMQKLNSAGN